MNKTMKNKLFIAILFLFTLFSIGTMAEASTTISFDSSDIKTNLNGDFSVNVYVNSSNVNKDYTSRVALRFSSEQLSVKNFEFADGWMPLYASGYDLVDNTNYPFREVVAMEIAFVFRIQLFSEIIPETLTQGCI